jgi:CRP-like cAMP-binding protein
LPPDVSGKIAELSFATVEGKQKSLGKCKMGKSKYWYYEHANFFEVLNNEQLQNLEQFSKIIHFKKGHLMCGIDDLCDYIYIVKKGIIKVFLLTPEGKETIITIRLPGNIIGLTAIFGWPRRVSYVAALSNVDVLKVRTEDIKNMILNDKKLSEFIIKMLCARLHHSRRLIYNLSTKNVRDRLISLMVDLMNECGLQKDDGILINLELTHEQISQMIAASRQSVTVILNDLERKKIIKNTQKKITIHDRNALFSLIESSC